MNRYYAVFSLIFLLILLAGCPPTQSLNSRKTALPEVVTALEKSNSQAPRGSGTQRNALLAPSWQLPAVTPLTQPLAHFVHHPGVHERLPYYGDFPLETHQRVEALVKRYSGSQRHAYARWLSRAGRYIPKIQMVFADEGLPLDLAYLAMIESGFNMRAYSWAKAAGPWQFIESTGRLYGLSNDWWQDGRLDLEKSTRAAARHLKYLHKRFDGDWYLAVAAYNAGGGTVRKAVRKGQSRDFWDLVDGNVLREETKNYVPKLLAALHLIRDPQRYGFSALEFQPPLEYENVTMHSSTDLEIIAGFAGVSYKHLKELNPELKRWCTPPGVKNYQLHVPPGSADKIAQLYADLPAGQRASYHRHKIRPGDNLQSLAKKYHIQVKDIVALNKIKNPRAIQIGTNLILPLKKGFTSLPVDALADSYIRSRRKTYRVRSGDSLWSIAKRFDVSQKELRVWNKLGWSNMLRPGQLLAVSKAGKARVASKSKKKKSGPTRKLVYKVAPGDTLWGIGRRFDVATDEIRRWNELSRSHVLKPGQKLTLKVSSHQG